MVPNILMATLQKQVSRKVGDKEYSKFVIVIPPEEIRKSGFEEGEELKFETKEGRIILKK